MRYLQNLIYINHELGEDVECFFKKITVIGQITNVHAREYGLTVYLCQQPEGRINEIYQAAVKRESR